MNDVGDERVRTEKNVDDALASPTSVFADPGTDIFSFPSLLHLLRFSSSARAAITEFSTGGSHSGHMIVRLRSCPLPSMRYERLAIKLCQGTVAYGHA